MPRVETRVEEHSTWNTACENLLVCCSVAVYTSQNTMYCGGSLRYSAFHTANQYYNCSELK